MASTTVVKSTEWPRRPAALLQEIGDVFATVGAMFVGILEGADERCGAVDFEQAEDFLDMMAGVEAARLELLVVGARLRTQTQEALEQVPFARLESLGQQGLGVVGMFKILMPVVGADVLADALIFMIEAQAFGIDFGGEAGPGQRSRHGVAVGVHQDAEAAVDGNGADQGGVVRQSRDGLELGLFLLKTFQRCLAGLTVQADVGDGFQPEARGGIEGGPGR
jgi:hypothetical protein